MPIPSEILEKQHKGEVFAITDPTSLFSFGYSCACGVQGHFFTKQEADEYRGFHRRRQGL